MVQLQENALFGEHNRYRLIRLLGQGGYSEVWLAEDTKVGITIAIKIYAPGRGLDEDGVSQFSKEFKLVFNLNHANLLRPAYYDVFQRMPYLILPLCERGSSVKLAGKFDEETAWKFLRDVASGLAFLHAQEPPFIHQDIKPENVLLDDNDSFLITDFGISTKVRNTLQSAGSKAGTMVYMAPERFNTDYQPIKASDVWALGASLFELMTGKPPFGESGGIAQKRGMEIPVIQGVWSQKLKNIIIKCLQEKTWERPTAKTISEEAKIHLLEGPIGSTAKPQSRNIKILLACAVLVLGLSAGFFAGNFMNKSENELNPALQECILIIEQADSIFDENNLSTWRETLMKYLEAKELTSQHSLQLPDMEHRIGLLQKKMDDVINISIENAKKALAVRSEMALFAINDVLELNPEHAEAKTLLEQYKQIFPNK